ncbi:hypothetical protein EOPP23_04950 [Endozoicomonas sp. OPT23]|nr:hypothetical protein [Endozoicomonas sp. OPT23]
MAVVPVTAVYGVDKEEKGSKLGVCVSGGGSRSFSLSRGYFAWMKQNGIEEQIDYLSLVSGSAWFAAAYFGEEPHRNSSTMKEDFNPERLKLGAGDAGTVNLFDLEPNSLGRRTQEFSNLLGFAWYFIVQKVVGNPTETIWADFLVDALTPSLKMAMDKWSFPGKPEKMNLIISALLKTASQTIYPFEMQPGAAAVRTGRKLPERMLAGEYTRCTDSLNGSESVIRVQDAVAASSANFPHFLPDSLSHLYLPDYCLDECVNKNYQSHSSSLASSRFKLLDNGPVDYLGIMPLLARPDTGKIIALVNTDISISSTLLVDGTLVVGLEKAVTKLFGIKPDETASELSYQPLEVPIGDSLEEAVNNSHVFSRGRYQELVEALYEKKSSGQAAVYLQKDLEVFDNEYHGVKGGRKVDVLWVYNEKPEIWWQKLGYDIQTCLTSYSGVASYFDCYSTWTNFPSYNSMLDLYLPALQSNLLRQLAGWTLNQNKQLIYDWFHPQVKSQ